MQQRFEEWREGSASAIREWLPKVVDLASAYPEVIDDPIHWAKDKVWETVEQVCGIQRVPESETLPIDWVVSDIMMSWFAVASEFNPEGNAPPLRPWTAPRWLTRDRRETDELLEKHTRKLWLRINLAINETIELEEIRTVSNRKVEAYKAASSSAPQRPKPGELMAAPRESGQTIPLLHPESEARRKPPPGRPRSSLVATRQAVLRKIAATGVTGERYCEEVVNAQLDTPREWLKRDGCPKSYLDAWNHPDPQRRKTFRHRISDEKCKAKKRDSPKIDPLA